MSQHLKTRIIDRLASTIATFKQLPPDMPVHSKGVRYLVPIECYNAFWGAMNTVQEGRKYHKHIIVRHCPSRPGLLQLYTYHFPKTWSKACVANRELIKEAQRQAHALEHDYSHAAIEWRIRFFKHYFRVFKGGAKPEPGLKPYSRFYQYVYVAIYRQLQAARDAARQAALELPPTADDVTFDPIEYRPLRSYRTTNSLQNVVERVSSPPLWQDFHKIVT